MVWVWGRGPRWPRERLRCAVRSCLYALHRTSTRLITLLSALALLAASLAGVAAPASGAVAAAKHLVAPAAVKPDNKVAVPRAMADMALARREHRKVGVAVDQTAYSQTVANPNGTLTTTVSQRPRWVRRGASWETASADLTRDVSGSWSPKAALAGLQLSGGGHRT